MNICICGYYGKGNFGDELFLKTFKQIFSKHKIIPWQQFIDKSQIDCYIVGGGDLITPYFFNNHYFPMQLEDKPIWIYGIGIVDAYGPVEKEIQKYLPLTTKAQKFVVRDEASAKIARDLNLNSNIEVLPDIVFGYDQPDFPITAISSKKTIGVCIHSYSDEPINIIHYIADKGLKDYRILVIPMIDQASNQYSDVLKCKQLVQGLKDKNFDVDLLSYGYDLDTTCSVIQSLDMIISFKLHPSLIAIRNLVPVFCFSDQSKTKNLLNYFGLGDFVTSVNLDYTDILTKINYFLENGGNKTKAAKSKIIETESASKGGLIELRNSIENYFGME